MKKPLHVFLDYETRSRVDPKAAGGYEYAKSYTTEILCLAYKIGGDKVKLWDARKPFPASLLKVFNRAVLREDVLFHAHNAFFEQCITRFALARFFASQENGEHAQKLCMTLGAEPRYWRCTAVKAASHSLPRSLEGAGAALGLAIQKDKEGHRLMLKYCKPRRHTLHNDADWHNDEDELQRLFKYCVTDVRAEYTLDRALPSLPKQEQELWFLDQRINARGFQLDTFTVQMALTLIDKERKRIDEAIHALTKGRLRSTQQREKLLKYVRRFYPEFPNLQAKTIGDFLRDNGNAPNPAVEALKLRLESAKASTAKYAAFLQRVGNDDRIRDNLVFWGASTGRFTARGVQVQNFPKGKIKDSDNLIELIRLGDNELIRSLYTSPMEAFSSALRSMITAREGMTLFSADYSSIEVRVLFWLARHQDGCRAFFEGRDLYVEMAAEIYDKKVGVISKARPYGNITPDERDLGKRAILGCGYNMGWKKFLATCEQWGSPISVGLAKRAVAAYRKLHFLVPALWRKMELAAVQAVKTRKKMSVNGLVTFHVENDFLYMTLPSGRRIAYYGPKLKLEPTPWGQKTLRLYHWAENPKTKKWEFTSNYGGKLVENAVQGIARDIMCHNMPAVEKAGFEPVLSVHDELLSEGEESQTLEQYEAILNKVPPWAKGCPVAAKGWKGFRYRKG